MNESERAGQDLQAVAGVSGHTFNLPSPPFRLGEPTSYAFLPARTTRDLNEFPHNQKSNAHDNQTNEQPEPAN
jgi:hypothetical protein